MVEPGFGQRVKERWNGEVEGIVRRMQGMEWRTIREGVERRYEEWSKGERKV